MTRYGAIFDLDGTLVNTIPLIQESFVHTHRVVLGEDLAPETCLSWIGLPLTTIYAQWPRQQQDLTQAYLAYNYDLIATRQQHYLGITELIDDLIAADIAIAVATSKSQRSAQRSLEVAGLSDRITAVVALESTAEHKPHPAPLLAAAQLLTCVPERCAYIGDAVTDMQAARAAKMCGIGVTWGAATRAELVDSGYPHFVAQKPSDIAVIVRNVCA
ncbi:MAG: HAD family hydrolase [Propionibacteriaceae bacterium]